MRRTGFWWFVIAIFILVDVYFFQAVATVMQEFSSSIQLVVTIIYWIIALAAWLALFAMPYLRSVKITKFYRNYIFSILVGIFIAKITGCVFFVADDIRRGIEWLVHLMPAKNANMPEMAAIHRSVAMSWLGIGFGTTLLGTFIYGYRNKYNYQIKYVCLHFPNLPKAFKGFKIAQISDVHSGSFTNKQQVIKGVNLLMLQNADVVLFTGDLVNDRYEEMNNYIDVFNKVSAPFGVYSILGNHDYGDYIAWPSLQAKQQNLENLKKVHATLGWRLLMNEHVIIEKNTDAIALIGIENWGAKGRFPKYGKMEQAYKGTETYAFKILMSHDPSHWDAEVRPKYADIDLMLSGHTHGMQFGVETVFFKFSPVQWMYKQWAGLYKEGNQYLYVNRGFGFIGYPGRVGILPEITIIELS